MKKFISCILILCISSITFFSFGSTCTAASAPSQASYSYYVPHNWLDMSGGHTIAYNTGKAAVVGTGTVKYYFLGFGRQRQDTTSSDGWGVKLPNGDNTNETDDWVKSVVQEFRNGYDASTNPSAIVIVVGTNNDEIDWPQGQGSTLFSTAGTKWATCVNSISGGSFSSIRGGNDFEGWVTKDKNGILTFTTYGNDAVTWMNSYNLSSSGLFYNYGNECYAESGSPYWTQYQVYQVSYGFSCCEVLPELYNQTADPPKWVTLTTYLKTNGGYTIIYKGIVGNVNWSIEWNNLNNGLTTAQFPNILESSATWGL